MTKEDNTPRKYITFIGSKEVMKRLCIVNLYKSYNKESEYTPQQSHITGNCVKIPDENKIIIIFIIDINEYSKVQDYYLNASDLIVLFYDITNRNSLNHLQKYVSQERNVLSQTSPHIILVGTNANEEDKREVQQDEAKEKALFFQTLIFNNENNKSNKTNETPKKQTTNIRLYNINDFKELINKKLKDQSEQKTSPNIQPTFKNDICQTIQTIEIYLDQTIENTSKSNNTPALETEIDSRNSNEFDAEKSTCISCRHWSIIIMVITGCTLGGTGGYYGSRVIAQNDNSQIILLFCTIICAIIVGSLFGFVGYITTESPCFNDNGEQFSP